MRQARPSTGSQAAGLRLSGGPWIDALARFGQSEGVPFAFAQHQDEGAFDGEGSQDQGAKTSPIADLDPRFMFSFSGIKTAVLRYVETAWDARRGAGEGGTAFAAGSGGGEAAVKSKDEALLLCPAAGAGFGGQLQCAVVAT